MRYEDDEDYAPRPARRTSLGTVVVVSGLTSCFVSALVVYAMHRFGPADPTAVLEHVVATPPARADVGSQAQVRVPELIGQQVEVAEKLLSAQKLELVVRQHLADATLPAGAVFAQRPPSGSMAEAGGVVEVMVSTGPANAQTAPAVADTSLKTP